MLTLGIHCAGASCDIALLSGESLIVRRVEVMKRGQDQRLPVMTSDVLTEAGISVSDLGKIAVCVGPGSFTGTRVGVAFARGLALANKSKAIGVTSLEAMAAMMQDRPAIAILPAKQRPPDISYWVQGFMTEHLNEAAEISAENLPEYFTGQTIGLSPARISDQTRELVPFAQSWQITDSCALGVARFAIQSRSDDLRPASPVYVRDPDAIPAKPVATQLSV